MQEVYTLLVIFAPAVAGSALALGVTRWAGQRSPGIEATAAATGGLLGYFLLAIYIRLCDTAGVQVFGSGFCIAMILIGLASTLAWFLLIFAARHWDAAATKAQTLRSKKRSFQHSTLILVTSIIVANTVLIAAISPVSSWDGLGLWVTWADFFLQFEIEADGYKGMTRAQSGAFPLSHPRHPPSVYHLSAFTGFLAQSADLIRGWLVPWSVIWFLGSIIVWGVVLEVSSSIYVATLSVFLYVTQPLLANHALLVGYADLWITITVTASAACLSLALYKGSPLFWAIGLFMASALLLLKNTGAIYAAALILPLGLVKLGLTPKNLAGVACVLGGAFATALTMGGFDISLHGQRLALIADHPLEIVFGGRALSLGGSPFSEVLGNTGWALLANQSFNTTFGIWCVGLACVPLARRYAGREVYSGLTYLCTVIGCILLAFMIPQLDPQYASVYATPQSDTGNSRFLMAIGPLTLLSLGFSIKTLVGLAARTSGVGATR